MSAMGSPDPDGRQIDGMGGGISSLSKVAIVSPPGEALRQTYVVNHSSYPPSAYVWPDKISWADDINGVERGFEPATPSVSSWDIVYRFAQVGVREPVLDWSTTCGNLIAAVAQFAVNEGMVSDKIENEVQRLKLEKTIHSLPISVNILATDSGKIFKATLNVSTDSSEPGSGRRWAADTLGSASISGVPGTASPIEIQAPLVSNILPTGKPLDTISVDGLAIPFTTIDAGLPCIFVSASDILKTSDPEALATFAKLKPDELDADGSLHARLEQVRQACSLAHSGLAKSLSMSAPKICIVLPPSSYKTTGEGSITSDEIDCNIRAVSVGNFHRTVPATMLSALAVARAMPSTVVATLSADRPWSGADGKKRTIRVGQPAGISEASIMIDDKGSPTSILYIRTARCLFNGQVMVPFAV